LVATLSQKGFLWTVVIQMIIPIFAEGWYGM